MNNAIGNAQLGGGEVDLSAYQQITDNNLKTTSKEVVGAINEINSRMGELTIYTDLAQLFGREAAKRPTAQQQE